MHSTVKPDLGQVTPYGALNRPLLNTYDPESVWQQLASGRVEVHDIRSSQEGMFRKPHVDELAAKLKGSLERQRKRSSAN